MNISRNCFEDVTNGEFSIQLQYAFGSCKNLHPSDYTTSTTPLSAHSTCLPVGSGTGDFCYQATVMFRDTIIDTTTSLNFSTCSIAEFRSFLGAGVSYQLDGVESGGSVTHLTTATLSCESTIQDLSGTAQTTCVDGMWSTTETRSCSSEKEYLACIIISHSIFTCHYPFVQLLSG